MVGEMNNQVFQPSKSKLGDIDAKWMVLISYLGMGILAIIPGASYVAWLVPLIIYLIDKDNKFIAFHAMQALLLGVFVTVINIIILIILLVSAFGIGLGAATLNPFAIGAGFGAAIITGIIAVVIGILALIFAIIAMTKGMKYEIYEIPIVGKLAEKIVFKTS
jgi:uncharacterized membrane protein